VATSPAPIPDRPALAPWCRVAEDDGRVLLEHGGTVVTLAGKAVDALLPRLLPLLDGTRSVAEIGSQLGRAAAPAVENALSLLAAHQLLVDGPSQSAGDEVVTAAAAYAAAVTRRTTPAAAVEALTTARVRVLGSGVLAEELRSQLGRMGMPRVGAGTLTTDAVGGDLVVAAPAVDEIPLLDRLNATLLEAEKPWLQVLPHDGRFLVVGPLVLPNVTACRRCYVLRRGACSGYEDDFDRIEAEPLRASAPFPLVSVAAGIAAVLALRWLTTSDSSLPGRYYALESSTILRLSHHRVVRVPRCRECGPSERAIASPWFSEAAA